MRKVLPLLIGCFSLLFLLTPGATQSSLAGHGEQVHTLPAVSTDFNCSNVTEIPQTECQALVALYNSTGGNNWNINIGWLTNNEPCSWYGVACGRGRVVRIDLHSNGLNGPIRPELGNLTNLWALYLDNLSSG